MNIIKSGGVLTFYNSLEVLKRLEPGEVCSLVVDAKGNFGLAIEDPFELPSKTYDFEAGFRNQIIKTLQHSSSNNNIGVLLTGNKGFGKSVTAKMLAIESGLPVILINQRIHKMFDFSSFLGEIKQDHVLFIDEFEKLFPKNTGTDKDNDFHTEDVFLTLLDGTQNSKYKRLCIMTTNSEVGDKFLSRPSRVRYYKQYYQMDQQVYDAIIADKLLLPEFEEDLRQNMPLESCSIDILSTIIEEINIQKIPYSQFKEFFNFQLKRVNYTITPYTEDGKLDYEKMEEYDSNKTLRPVEDDLKSFFSSCGISTGYGFKLDRADKDTFYVKIKAHVEDKNQPYEEDGETYYRHVMKWVPYRVKKTGLNSIKSNISGVSDKLSVL